MTLGRLMVVIGADDGGLRKALSDSEGRIQKFGSSALRAGTAMTAGITLPTLAAGAAILKVGGQFEASMNQVQAVTRASQSEITALSDQAKELGATTQFSASQAADAMYFLASAGFDTNEVLGAMPGTLQLAAAAQMDLATAADITSNILSGYGMEVEELGRVNDTLVRTFQLSNTNLQQLGEAFKMAGPVASGVGIAFEEAAAALGLMGNAGIQASMAGTSMRGALVRLLNPVPAVTDTLNKLGISVKDSEGNLKSLTEIVTLLETSGADTADMMALFGQRAGPAMAALVDQGSDALAEMTGQLLEAGGTAERVAEVQMRGFSGAMKELKSAAEGLAIAIGESGLQKVAEELGRSFATLIRSLTDIPGPVLMVVTAMAGLAATIGPLLLMVGTMIKLAPLMAAAWVKITGPIGLTVAAIAALIAIGALLVTNWTETKIMMQSIWYEIKRHMVKQIDEMLGRLEIFLGWIPKLGDKIRGARRAFNDFAVNSLGKTGTAIYGLEQRLINVDPAISNAADATNIASDAMTAATDTADALRDALSGVETAAGGAAAALSRQMVISPKIDLAGYEAPDMDFVNVWSEVLSPSVEELEVSTKAAAAAYLASIGPITAVSRVVREMPNALDLFKDKVKSVGSSMLSAIGGAVGSAATGILSALNPLSIIATIIDQAFRDAITSLEVLAEPIGDIVSVLATALEPIFQALVPIVEALGPPLAALAEVATSIIMALMPILEALVPVFDAVVMIVRSLAPGLELMAQILTATLVPVLQILEPILRGVAWVFSWVMEAVGWFIKGLGEFIDRLVPDWISHAGKGLADMGDEMIDNARAARQSTDALEGTAAAADSLSESLLNAVKGFKLAGYEHRAADPYRTTPPSNNPSNPSGPGPRGPRNGPDGTIAHASVGDININTSGDGRETYRNFYNELDQRTRSVGGPAREFFRSLPEPA